MCGAIPRQKRRVQHDHFAPRRLVLDGVDRCAIVVRVELCPFRRLFTITVDLGDELGAAKFDLIELVHQLDVASEDLWLEALPV